MRHLCDSNFFLALVFEAHSHHARAKGWADDLPEGASLIFCRASQQSFLRLLTRTEIMGEKVCTNTEAIGVYRTLRTDQRVAFAGEPSALEEEWLKRASHRRPSPKLWMDSYLAAFAKCSGMSFVTFDRGFGLYPGLELILL